MSRGRLHSFPSLQVCWHFICGQRYLQNEANQHLPRPPTDQSTFRYGKLPLRTCKLPSRIDEQGNP